jgi:hypothetical protein
MMGSLPRRMRSRHGSPRVARTVQVTLRTRAVGRAVATAVAIGLALAAAGCALPGPAARSAAAVVIPPAPRAPGERLPVPAGAPVLTISGQVGRANVGQVVQLDDRGLDSLGRIRIDLYEPWVKQRMGFQGVWLADVLDAAGVDDDAQSLHITALDNYQVDLPLADVRSGGVLLATRTGDGGPIPVGDGGPIRIVFADEVEAGSNANQWIWSLTTIDVR